MCGQTKLVCFFTGCHERPINHLQYIPFHLLQTRSHNYHHIMSTLPAAGQGQLPSTLGIIQQGSDGSSEPDSYVTVVCCLPDASHDNNVDTKRALLSRAVAQLFTELGFSLDDKAALPKKLKQLTDKQVVKFFKDEYTFLCLQHFEGHTEVLRAMVNQLMTSCDP